MNVFARPQLKRRSLRHHALVATALCSFYLVPRAQALTYTWVGNGANGSWQTAANWNPGFVPNATYLTDLIFNGSNKKTNYNDVADFKLHSLSLQNTGWYIYGKRLAFQSGGLLESFGTNNQINNDLLLQKDPLSPTNLFNLNVLGGGSTLSLYGDISGTSQIVKKGTGSVILYGTNTSTGGMDIQEGSVWGHYDSYSGPLHLSSGTSAYFFGPNSGSFTGNISGDGTLIKRDDFTLTLTGINTLTGGLDIQGGSVIGNTNSFSGDIKFSGAATGRSVVFNQAFDATFFDNITATNAETLRKKGLGIVTLVGNVSSPMHFAVEAGTLVSTPTSYSNDVDVALGATYEMNVAKNAELTYGGDVSGAGRFRKSGDGALVLNKAIGTTDAFEVTGGRVTGTTQTLTNHFDLAKNTVLELNQGAPGTFTGQLVGEGSVRFTGGATYDFMAEQNSWTGRLAALWGTVKATPRSMGSSVSLLSAGVLEVDTKSEYFYNGLVNGNGTLRFVHGTILDLSNPNSQFSGRMESLSNYGNLILRPQIFGSETTVELFSGPTSGIEFISGGDYNFFGKFQGSGQFFNATQGIVTMKNADVFKDYTGDIEIYSGGIRINSHQWNGPVELIEYDSPLYVNQSFNDEWKGQLIGRGVFVKEGIGALKMASQEWKGLTRVAGGSLVFDNSSFSSERGYQVDKGGEMRLRGEDAMVYGGAIQNAGTVSGTGTIGTDLFNNLTGKVLVDSNDRLKVTGDVNNSGAIQLNGGVLQVDGTLANKAGSQISGRGTLRTGQDDSVATLKNEGAIAFSGGFSDVYGDVSNTGNGQLMSVGGGVATYHGDVVHNGKEIRTSAGARTVFLGSLSGAGSFTGSGTVEVQGDLRPGNSPALVTFDGDLELGSTATTTMELGGLLRGTQYDALNIKGHAYLGGALDVVFYKGFDAKMGDTFHLFDGSLIGQFDSLSLPQLNGGMHWDLSGLYTHGNIAAVPEPTSMIALAAGLGVMLRRRRR